MGRDMNSRLLMNSREWIRSKRTVPDNQGLREGQERIRREIEENLDLQDGKSIQELAKEANQRLRVARNLPPQSE